MGLVLDKTIELFRNEEGAGSEGQVVKSYTTLYISAEMIIIL